MKARETGNNTGPGALSLRRTVSIASIILIFLSLFCFSHAGDRVPKRIVSLAPSITQSLYALGVRDSVVGVTVHCPPDAGKDRIGTLWEPNIEKIVSLSPDVVFATKEGNKKEVVEKLEKFGIRVETLESDRNYRDICDNFMKIGRVTGSERKAREIIADSDRRIRAVQERVSKKRPVRVFWEVGSRPLCTISGNTFVDDFCRYTGTANIFADVSVRYPRISREEVIKRDPEAILIILMGDVTDGERAYWNSFSGLAAVRANRVFIIKAEDIFTPTPMTFAKGTELIAELLHSSPPEPVQ